MKSLLVSAVATLAVTILVAPQVQASSACDGLSGNARAVADQVLASAHPYDECDDVFAKCLAVPSPDPLVRRLADWICRKAASGQDAAAIQRSLERRAMSMMRPGRTHEIALDQSCLTGCSEAKTRVAVYLCARCPYCSKLLPGLYREVTAGRLAGKVAMHLRIFPIKGHAHSTEANVAVGAAASMGKGWEYLLRLYRGFDAFKPDVAADWAAEVGLDKTAFAAAMESPETRNRVVEAKKEGIRNGVDATPTFFINGRRWNGDLDLDTLIDAIEEEIDATR
jgi:protein-disulfide isomerase